MYAESPSSLPTSSKLRSKGGRRGSRTAPPQSKELTQNARIIVREAHRPRDRRRARLHVGPRPVRRLRQAQGAGLRTRAASSSTPQVSRRRAGRRPQEVRRRRHAAAGDLDVLDAGAHARGEAGRRGAVPRRRGQEVRDPRRGAPEEGRPRRREGPRGPRRQGAEKSMPPATGELAKTKPKAAASAYNPNLNYWTPTAYTNGKVFFNMGGGSFVCSATIVNTEGHDTVWTAGHCVHGGSGGSGRPTGSSCRPTTTTSPTRAVRHLDGRAAVEPHRLDQQLGLHRGHRRRDHEHAQRLAHRRLLRRPRHPRQQRQERLRGRLRLPGRVAVRRRQPVPLLGHLVARVAGPVDHLRDDQDPVRHDPRRERRPVAERLRRQLGLPERHQQPDRPDRRPDDDASRRTSTTPRGTCSTPLAGSSACSRSSLSPVAGATSRARSRGGSSARTAARCGSRSRPAGRRATRSSPSTSTRRPRPSPSPCRRPATRRSLQRHHRRARHVPSDGARCASRSARGSLR